MSELKFSTEEESAIAQYSRMSVRVGSAINSIAAELIPAIAAFGYGLYREKTIFVVLGMFILVYAAGYRAFKQFKYAKLLQSICTKLIKHKSSHDPA